MITKLNSFILSDNMTKMMKKKLTKTEQVRKELGFNMCKIEDSNALRDDIHCTGTQCEIILKETCRSGKKVGIFHTHPSNGGLGMSDPSLSDLEIGYYYGMNCVGGVADKKIRCYVRKDKEINQKDYDTIRYHRKRFATLDEPHYATTQADLEIVKAKFRERNYIRDKLRDSYFDMVDIV